MNRFADHFSGAADEYARYRPVYPSSLFATLARLSPACNLAWDCATGNGQAALGLADHFQHVYASDASAEQIRKARPHSRIEYHVAPAERSGLNDASVDLITIAQALHWFDHPAFYQEVRRVARPGALIVAWTYVLLDISPQINAVVSELHGRIVGDWWPPERRHVDNGYRDLPFPFEPVSLPAFTMTAQWTLSDLLGYLHTWSATRRYQHHHGRDPVALIEPQLRDLWGPEQTRREVRWPLGILAGRI
jgi:SAM-dependent methyltransferase